MMAFSQGGLLKQVVVGHAGANRSANLLSLGRRAFAFYNRQMMFSAAFPFQHRSNQ